MVFLIVGQAHCQWYQVMRELCQYENTVLAALMVLKRDYKRKKGVIFLYAS